MCLSFMKILSDLKIECFNNTVSASTFAWGYCNNIQYNGVGYLQIPKELIKEAVQLSF